MKLKILLLLFCLNFSMLNSYGQLDVGDIAPDFTMTDINGVEHNLYDILDEGKTVVIDVMATWCSPCWEFHNNGVLKDLWEERGPNGTDDIYVFMIESDQGTTLDMLNGIGPGTEGDWVTGTTYPIIDVPDGSFEDAYNIVAYPTTYVICPDKRIVDESNWQALTVASIVDISSGCPSLTGMINSAVFSYTDQVPTDCGAFTFSPEFSFQNLGENEITTSVIDLSVDGNLVQSLEWTGQLGPFNVEEVIFDEITLTSNAILDFDIVSVNGVADEVMDDNVLNAEVKVPSVVQTDSLIVEILTDEYGAETYWAILDDQGELAAEGGNLLVGFDSTVVTTGVPPAPTDGTEYQPNTLYQTTVGLPANGCYTLVVTDYYEDGLCCEFGDGYYKILSTDGDEILSSIGTTFGHRADTPFGRDAAVSVKPLEANAEISLLGNPITDMLRFRLGLEDSNDVRYMITNTLGQVLYQSQTTNFAEGQHNLEVDVAAYAEGVYSLTVFVEEGIKTISFIKN